MPLYRRSPTGPWWYRFKVDGSEYRGSTGTRDRREAQSIERRARADADATPRATGGGIVDLAQLGEWDVERSAGRNSSKAWRSSLERQWAHLVLVLGARTSATSITKADLARYVQTRNDAVCGETIARELQTLKRGMQIAIDARKLARMPSGWPEVARVSSGRGSGRYVPPEVLRPWLATLAPSARDEAIVVLLTAIRDGEVKRLEWSWVESSPTGGYLLRIPAPRAKAKKGRAVGLPEAAYAVLERLGTALPTGPLFFREHKTARRLAAKRVGWPRSISLRDLRHTHGTIAAAHGGDLRSLQMALGHADLETTERYVTGLRATAVAGVVAESVGWHSEGGTPEPWCAKPEVHWERATGLEPATLSLGIWVTTPRRRIYACLRCLDDALDGIGVPELLLSGGTAEVAQAQAG